LIEKNPQEEANYISLIFCILRMMKKKAFEIVQKLENPKFRMGAGNFIQKIFGC
jgi:hypothetical protein